MTKPYLTIDLNKITHNARVITQLCAHHGIEVIGVTKGTCGHPAVAHAMLRGGVVGIGESRLENIQRLRAAGVNTDFMLLRTPALSQVDDVIATVDVSLNSELSVIAALAQATHLHGKIHSIIIMVDLGDLREGVLPEDLNSLVEKVKTLNGVEIAGIGTNLSCYGGVVPSPDNMGRLVGLANDIENRLGSKLLTISGGNSSSLPLIASGQMPSRINQMRIGEAILLGRETLHRSAWPQTFQDVFQLQAEIIELKRKPSRPLGEIGEDAFGGIPEFVDQGERLRALLDVGREDIAIEGVKPLDSRLRILGASSDHLIVDVTAVADTVKVGDELSFSLNYAALLAAMTSPYVEKRVFKVPTDHE